MSQGKVAVVGRVDQDAEGDQVMNLAHFSPTLLQLAVDASQVFLPCLDLGMNTSSLHLFL